MRWYINSSSDVKLNGSGRKNKLTLVSLLQLKPQTSSMTCSICGHISRAPSSFRYHMMRHSGRFPHHCPYCQQGAPSTTDVKKHLMRYHTGKMGCHCLGCGQDLFKLSLLREHLKTCHALQEIHGDSGDTHTISEATWHHKLDNVEPLWINMTIDWCCMEEIPNWAERDLKVKTWF